MSSFVEPFSMDLFWEECFFNRVCAINASCCICSLFGQPGKKIPYPHGPVEVQQLATNEMVPQVLSGSGEEAQLPQSVSINQQPAAASMQSFLAQFSGLIANGTSVDYKKIVAMTMALQSQTASPLGVPLETTLTVPAQAVASVAEPTASISEPVTSTDINDESAQDESLLTCSICGISVHRGCYGVSSDDVTSGWICKRCKAKAWEQRCVLCNMRGGALKQTACKKPSWAHITCAVAIPECSFGKSQLREPIHIDSISADRWTLVCLLNVFMDDLVQSAIPPYGDSIIV
jgi:hypothetical protein